MNVEDEDFYENEDEEDNSAGGLPRLYVIRASAIRGGSIEESVEISFQNNLRIICAIKWRNLCGKLIV